MTERRGSALTAEEIKQGIEFRKKALKSPDTDLASIARTAPVLSTSPTHPIPIVSDANVCIRVSSRLRLPFSLMVDAVR